MERTARIASTTWVAEHVAPATAGAWFGGFAIVLYLALSGGGYDPIVHGETGIAIWWIVLGGAATGVLSARFGRVAWVGLALLGGFAAWTAFAMTWTESAERTGAELARVTTYLGVLTLGLLLGRRSPRALLNGVGAAIAAVAGLAVLSRLHPAWFPANDHAQFLPEAINRLSYPLNSWNGLASFAALGIPVLAGMALAARSRLGQAAAAAALPVLALCVFLTASRGGTISAAVGLLAILVLFGDRLATAATLCSAGAGAAVLIVAAAQRDALERGAGGALAQAQGDELLVLLLIVCAGVGLLQVAIGLTARFVRRPAWMMPSPRRAAALGAGLVTVAIVAALGAGAGGAASRAFDEFRADPAALGAEASAMAPQGSVADRLATVSGNGRWQYWQSSLDAMRSDPLRGTGPGTFEFWWARNGTINGFVRDAHSLYFETLGESGIVGFALLVGLLLLLVLYGAARALRTRPVEDRLVLAAATCGVVVFAVAASVDWAWELPAVPCAVMLLAAVILSRGGGERRERAGGRDWGRPVLVAGGLAALLAISVPLAGASAVRRSQADVQQGRLAPALAEAGTAERTQPYAATPPLQRALVLELAGDHGGAAAAAREATAAEPTNWRTWLVRSRLEARAGDAESAVASFRKARDLNPRSKLLRP